MANNVIIPAQTKDTRIPLYAAVGLTEKESNAVYFEITENILPNCSTYAEALRGITDHQKLTVVQKVWAAYNLKEFSHKIGTRPESDHGRLYDKLKVIRNNLEARLPP
jgi:hypothetical protein